MISVLASPNLEAVREVMRGGIEMVSEVWVAETAGALMPQTDT